MGNGVVEVPHQVPPPSRRFVNRAVELAAAGELLGSGASRETRIAVFTGLPGVGKSWLARQLVEARRGTFPGGELYVAFDESDQSTESVSDALASCLLALGVDEKVIPSRLADRAGLFRTRTASSPTLVVLDDVSDPAQVLAFVPNAPGSAVLVTSNSRLTELRFEGAESLLVEPLDDAAAVHVIRELCDDRVSGAPEDLVRLARECGGLPVALRVAASRLLSRRGLTAGALADEIADSRRGLAAFAIRGEDKVSAVFSVGYAKLPTAAARVYRLLGAVAPASGFTHELAAAVVDIEVTECAELLDTIVEAGLLQDEPGGRFRFHGLVRRHASECALAETPEPERIAASRRLAEFVLERTAFGDLTVTGPGRYRCTLHLEVLGDRGNPFGGDKTAALDWMDEERPTIAAVIGAALEAKWYDLAWQLAESATALYANRRYLIEWTETSELGAQAARLAGHAAAEARLRSFSSRAWVEVGRPERARAELDTAFSLLEKAADTRLSASVWEMDGRYHEVAGDHEQALAAFHRSLELFGSAKDRRGAASLTYFIGCAQQALGRLDQAGETLRQALGLLREVGDAKMVGRALLTIGDGFGARGRDDEAQRFFEQSVQVLAESGDLFHESWAQEALAGLAERTGNRGLARACVARMVEIHTRLGGARVDELTQRLAELDQD